jgi:hypothetical protein
MTNPARLFGDVLPSTLDAVARGGIAASQAALPPEILLFHQQILRAFLGTGQPPSHQALATLADEWDLRVDGALRVLAAADLVHTDGDDGQVTVAYPLSGKPSPHRVRVENGPELSAMCAIDALGIPLMANTAATIVSNDPLSGQRIRIERGVANWYWEPETTVVVLATSVCQGRIADACTSTAFYADPGTATRIVDQLDVGRVLTQAEAIVIADAEFGPLLGGREVR